MYAPSTHTQIFNLLVGVHSTHIHVSLSEWQGEQLLVPGDTQWPHLSYSSSQAQNLCSTFLSFLVLTSSWVHTLLLAHFAFLTLGSMQVQSFLCIICGMQFIISRWWENTVVGQVFSALDSPLHLVQRNTEIIILHVIVVYTVTWLMHGYTVPTSC